jgi:tetratricopeptide (TPR) repeat protein
MRNVLVALAFSGILAVSSCGEEKEHTHVITGNSQFKTQEALDLNSQGIALIKSGDIEGGRALFLEALTYEEDNATLLGNIGNCAMTEGDNETAKSYFLQSIQADSEYLNSVVNYAGILYDEDNDSAVYWNEFILRKSSDNAQLGLAHLRLAYDAYNRSSCDDARSHCESAISCLQRAGVDLGNAPQLQEELKTCN